MHLFYTPDIARNAELPEEEAAHCLRVLRLQPGDAVMLTDGAGSFYEASIASTAGKRCCVEVKRTVPQQPLWSGHLHVALAPTKNIDRVEWFVEKATEIGVSEISFLDCRFSERKVVKMERIEKIVIAAMKQSLKARKPIVNPIMPFERFVKQSAGPHKYIAHCYQGEKPLLHHVLVKNEDALVLIGPEGDFSQEEVALALQHGFNPISLGRSRLRTETAALVACHLMNLNNQTI